MKRATILDRKNLYSCVAGQRVIKPDRLPIDQDQINLGMRDTARLDNVFYGRLFGEPPLDYSISNS